MAVNDQNPRLAQTQDAQQQDLQQQVRSVRRNRELYKYLEPHNLEPHRYRRKNSAFDFTDHAPNVTTALAPFAQLAALRCNAQKSMINVMDTDIMYFLAEATTTQPGAGSGHMFTLVDDPIFLGCSGVPLSGRICELTLRLDRVEPDHSYPIFIVQDLSQDSRFNSMSIVQHEPYYRFYAGTPIISRDGVSIGSLAVMDTKPRAGLTEDEERCLGETAEHIMTFFEINRQAMAGRRSRKLAEGLDCFVAGQHSLDDNDAQRARPPRRALRPGTRSAYGVPTDSQEEVAPSTPGSTTTEPSSRDRFRASSRSSLRSVSSEGSIESGPNSTPDRGDGAKEDPSSSAAKIFGRASNLIRQALELPKDAGVLFLDVNDRVDAFNVPKPFDVSPGRPSSPLNDETYAGSAETIRDSNPSRVLASSTWTHPIATGGADAALRNTTKLHEGFLQDILKRYPMGHIWAFGDNGIKLTSSDEEATLPPLRNDSSRKEKTTKRKLNESSVIQQAFPGARSVIYYPMFEVPLSLYPIAAFVFSCSETRPLTTSALTFLNSFCNTAKAEAARADAVRSDRQKTDFVSTISHETRSPLHGILASVEFLTESDLNGFQKSLVDTVEACGRTLLDTINHVLDYSKIASFEKNWHATNYANNRNRRRSTMTSRFANKAPQLLQLTATTDVSVILEEIVDGIAIGQTYHPGLDITDLSRESRGRGADPRNGAETALGSWRSDHEESFVEIILDIQKADWTFLTTPGSLRRVFMNIFGNAVKYTPATGSIRVELRMKDSDDEKESEVKMMLLTVTDTGRGISPQFLASQIYVPFSQENGLSPGTGLGLSIVRGIVTMLGGSIDIRSKVGEGTSVRVALPMTRPLPGSVSTTHTPSSNSTNGSVDSVQRLKDQVLWCRVAVVGFEKGGHSGGTPVLPYILAQYIQEWYEFEVVGPMEYDRANVIIVEDKDLDDVMRRSFGTSEGRPSLIVICSVTSRHKRTIFHEYKQKTDSLVVIAKPCGPYKLARALKTCLEKVKSLQPNRLEVISEQSTPYTPGTTWSSENVADRLQELDLGSPDNKDTATMVQATEGFAASQISQNAQMAIHDPSITSGSMDASKNGESFPFPAQEVNSQVPAVQPEPTVTFALDPIRRPASPVQEPTIRTWNNEELTQVPSIITPSEQQSLASHPRLLLVDDNKINLKLLQTFVRKRGYDHVDSAEDGQQALEAVKSASSPYEIIFMDISMPVMNGFEATERIRRFETESKVSNGALIIALTGLASARDQAEAFDVGCDIYLMKPVKFKEVGKLLDNWEAHQMTTVNDGEQRGSEETMRVAMAVGGALTADGFMAE